MKTGIYIISAALITIMILLVRCRKERSCMGCNGDNEPPVANAGSNQIISLPTGSVLLDGSKSYDPDENISDYSWTKIAGPYPFRIADANAVQTKITNLIEGSYQFELKVTDAGGLFDKDTVQVEVKPKEEQKPVSQQNLGNVFFYCPDPTGTVKYTWQTWSNGDQVNGLYNLITIKINDLTGTLAGIWCKNGCSLICPVQRDYNLDPGSYADFYLPAGTYSWNAENTITSFEGWPEVTPEFVKFFGNVHKVEDTIIVNPGDKCIVIPINFK